MPIELVEKPGRKAVADIISGEGIYLAATNSHLRSAEAILTSGNDPVIFGDRLFTPKTLITCLANRLKTRIDPLAEKVLVFDILAKSRLRYFEHVKNGPSTGQQFHRAINLLRKNMISAEMLEGDLRDRGSLKENDLLSVYKRYEDALLRGSLSDEGSSLLEIIEAIDSTGVLAFSSGQKKIRTIIFDGFDILPPSLVKLIQTISKKSKDTRIEIVRNALPESPIYTKFTALASKIYSEIGCAPPEKPSAPEDFWRFPCEIELHACRSAGNECRFVSDTICNLTRDGTDPRDISILAPPTPDTAEELLWSIKSFNLIPEEALTATGGLETKIKRAIGDAGSIAEIREALEKISSFIYEGLSIRENHIGAAAYNLRQIEAVLSDLDLLAEDQTANLDAIKGCLYADIIPSAESLIDTNYCAINWRRWGEENTSEIAFIPGAGEGSFPPEAAGSAFFQDTAFLPANAPLYFASLFPQPDFSRAREAFRFRRYLAGTGRRAILSYAEINPDGRERYPASICALLGLEPVVEKHRPHPRASSDFSVPKALKQRGDIALPVITDECIKSEIRKKFADHTFSASQMETYARCPYQYFLQRVAGLEPIEPVTPDINPKHRGTIMHYILELFFKNELEMFLEYIRGEVGEQAISEKIHRYTEESLEKHKELLENTHSALVDRFKKTASGACTGAVMLEAELIMKMRYPLLPERTEWVFGEGDVPCLTLSGRCLSAPAKFSGKIDRIDADFEHNRFAVTDYKTGGTEAVIGKIKKGGHLQLPLYIEAVQRLLLKKEEPVAAFLFSLKTMEKKHGVARKEIKNFYYKGTNPHMFVKDEEWDELIETTLKYAAEYVEKIRDSEFRPLKDSCDGLCDFREICPYEK